MIRRRSIFGGLLLGLALAAGSARGDSFVASSTGEGSGVPYTKVKVTGIKGDLLQYRTATGNDSTKSLSQVIQITLDDEPAFNEAEAAFVAEDFAKAADSYQRTVKLTTRDWVKDRAAQRLVVAAGKAGQFEAAVTGYVVLVARSPELAVNNKPTITKSDTKALGPAIKEVESAEKDPSLKNNQRVMLLSFLLELHRAAGDTKAAGDVAEQLLRLNAGDPSNPAAAMALADLKINLAHLAIDEKQYAKALETIDQNRGLFNDPSQQAQALYCIAQAKMGLAADSTDEKTLNDVALSFMRVVTVAKGLPGAPHVAESLMQTATLLERLKHPAEALDLYEQVAKTYPDSPTAKPAQAAADRLGKKK
jgi:TolA-binding protein